MLGEAWSSTMPVTMDPNEAPIVPAVLTQESPSVSDPSGTVSLTTRLPEANTGEMVRPVRISTSPITIRLPWHRRTTVNPTAIRARNITI